MQRKSEVSDVLKSLRINDGFWGRLVERNRRYTLPHVLKQCEEAGYIRNLEIAAGRTDAGFTGGSHEDSDVCKAIEGAAYSFALFPDAALASCLDALINLIEAAQEPDGYLNSYYTTHKEEKKYSDLHRSHELYVAGHLIEAAVAHFEATGKRTLLGVAVKLADHLDAAFGVGRLETVPGHQELELALVRLFKVTNEKRYLELGKYFVDMRGNRDMVKRNYGGKLIIEGDRTPGRNRPPEYRQDHMPAIDQREPVGHAVRALYFYSAMADIAMEYDSVAHADAVTSLWGNIVSKHLYITGGIGTHQNRDEGFGDDYLLPNDTYCETCGGIALLLFAHRMSLLKGDASCADVIEIILYNHMLACTDLPGTKFNYRNPLLSDGTRKRNPWPNPACCPTNIVRMIPQIGRFIYAVDGDDLYVDQFISSTASLMIDSEKMLITQTTNYPWDGRIEIKLEPEKPKEIALHIRIPGWVYGRPVPGDLYAADDAHGGEVAILVNGKPVYSAGMTRGYCVVRRTWKRGDRISIDFPMPVQRIHASDKVEADRGRLALMRGPILYCLEDVDHDMELDDITLSADTELTAEHVPGLLGGVTVIRGAGSGVALTAVPYYAWNNRRQGRMIVWLSCL